MRVGIEVLFWQGDTSILLTRNHPTTLSILVDYDCAEDRADKSQGQVELDVGDRAWSAAYWRDLSLDALFGKSLWSLFFTDWYKDTSSKGQELPPQNHSLGESLKDFKCQWHSAEWSKNDQMQGNFQHYIPDISQYIPGWVPFGALNIPKLAFKNVWSQENSGIHLLIFWICLNRNTTGLRLPRQSKFQSQQSWTPGLSTESFSLKSKSRLSEVSGMHLVFLLLCKTIPLNTWRPPSQVTISGYHSIS